MKKISQFKIGDRVKIKVKISGLEHRKILYGRIDDINGNYILVKPMWIEWYVECYPNELEKLERK